MNILLGVLVGLFVLMLLVTLHELGHFIMARRNGVTVKEFGIGFPPRAAAWVRKDGKWVKLPRENWNRPRKSLVFSLNWIPIGGFCSMDGESDSDTREGTFGAATFWQKTKILFGGVMMNWLTAFVILTVLAATGLPQMFENQYRNSSAEVSYGSVSISDIIAETPAARAGLAAGDQIISATAGDETVNVGAASDLIAFNSDHAAETVTYKILRADGASDFTVALNSADAEYVLGVAMSQSGQTLYRYPLYQAPLVGAVTTVQLTGETFRGLGDLVWNLISGVARQFSPSGDTREQGRAAIAEAGDSVSGPVGIIGVIFPAFVETGLTNLAFLAALISISLACMNVLPIPALDGGRWFLIALYRLLKKPLDQETESRVVSRAFLVLFAMIIVITILDIMRLF